MSAWLKKSRPCDLCPSDFPPMTHELAPIRRDRKLRAKLRVPQQRWEGILTLLKAHALRVVDATPVPYVRLGGLPVPG